MDHYEGLDIPDIYQEAVTLLLQKKYLMWSFDTPADPWPHLKRPLVFLNGCFDLLHAGHSLLLWKARQLANGMGGGSVVVALNSDESVGELKPGRPINCLGERLIQVASLDPVDYVTFFNDKNPEQLLRIMRPDVWLHGYDCTLPEPPPPVPELRKFMGKIVQIPTCSTLSTTHIINRVALLLGVLE